MRKSIIRILIVMLLAAFAFSIVASAVSTSDLRATTPVYRGIDVSHHQGRIDWNTVATQIDFVILRCGYGDDSTSYDDTQWARNVSECERLGIPYGVYLYSYASSDAEAQSEAEHALRLLAGHSPQLPVYLDLEDKVIANNCSNADILRQATIFCNRLQAAGYSVGIYANKNWWTTKLTNSAYDQWSRWIAIWGASSPAYDKAYDIWQYSSTGSVSGISGNVDMDYWYGELPTHQHSYTSSVTQEPSCLTTGARTYVCSCGASYTETIAALGHDWSEWTATNLPTCTAEGVNMRSCSRCGQQETQTITMTEHQYTVQTIPPACTEDGYDLYTCSVCGDTYTDSVVPATGHSFVSGICSICEAIDPTIQDGDINLDGQITSADTVMLARFIVDLAELNQAQMEAADMNNDGVITSADIVILAQQLTH
ncbi:MAG: hypothetical protein IJG45_00175 [Oscillospiraceae bacterium]|nr:hypothetical protein [Oscillospiraceae bacterium]